MQEQKDRIFFTMSSISATMRSTIMYGFFGIGFQEQLGKRLLGTVSILDRVGLPHRFQSVLRQFENLF